MFSGSIVALVTPMEADGTISYSELARLIEFHIEQGSDGIVIAGTTGESATLEHEEHIELIARACEMAGGRIPIIAGTGSNSTAQTLRLSRSVDGLGVAGLLVVTPYYNKPTQHGMAAHFLRVADAVAVPIILYNVPGRTAVDLLPPTVIELSRHANICGIKEATGDMDRVKAIREGAGPDFDLLSGDDATCCEFMLLGGDGVISVTANVAPRAMHDLCEAARAGQRQAAERIDAALQRLHADLFLESNPIPVKWAVHRMGLASAGIRLPLTELSAAHHAAVLAAMDRANVTHG
jgi:4-hydroxy-tetrahydrodipicolinate synthase